MYPPDVRDVYYCQLCGVSIRKMGDEEDENVEGLKYNVNYLAVSK